jgi:hypothetical protein
LAAVATAIGDSAGPVCNLIASDLALSEFYHRYALAVA